MTPRRTAGARQILTSCKRLVHMDHYIDKIQNLIRGKHYNGEVIGINVTYAWNIGWKKWLWCCAQMSEEEADREKGDENSGLQ